MKHRVEGFLYSIKRNKLTIREGYIEIPDTWDGVTDDVGHFYYKDPTSCVLKYGEGVDWSTCSLKPGYPYNDLLWLGERNDDRARVMFILREKVRIEELKESIHKYEQKIEMIRGLF